ncbi:MAG: hypothetical protein AAGA09_01830 [Pseudomonadota bacterium]
MWRRGRIFVAAALILGANGAFAQEPPLPVGLGGAISSDAEASEAEATGDEEPALPAGLGRPQGGGLSDKTSKRSSRRGSDDRRSGHGPVVELAPLTGFLEGRVGPRLRGDAHQGAFSLAEARLRLETEAAFGAVALRVVGDGVFDSVVKDRTPDLETGEGAFDLRELNIVWRPTDFADLKVGRQVLTWGVGDLIFINDLFPKDFQSFFIGRDAEYLKAPSDAARLSLFNDVVNVDLVYTPRFDPDRFINGSRLSYFNPVAGVIVGRNAVLEPETPDDWFNDDEFAARAYRQVGAFEAALYGYIGYFKGPTGLNASGAFFFPRLRVYGASARGPFAGGIVTAEFGRYISADDPDGSNPAIPNGSIRYLAGFEREIAQNFTASIQYYGETRTDHAAFVAAAPPGGAAQRTRHLTTLRLTRQAFNQNLTLSLLNFWSPNEYDGHVRLRASYKVDDAWLVEGGGNFFYGPRNDALFSQLKDNTNLFVAVRRSF